jgi:Fe2+ transport system protein FeoA
MAAMTFRELVDDICRNTGQSVDKTLSQVRVRADVCMDSLRAAYGENLVLPKTAHRLMAWCNDEHPTVELGLIHLLTAPAKPKAAVDWCRRAEEALSRALSQLGLNAGCRVCVVASGGEEVWSVELNGSTYYGGDGSLRGCLEEAKGAVNG